MKKRIKPGVGFFLNLVVLRERYRCATRRLVIRMRFDDGQKPVNVPIHFRSQSFEAN